jgi:cation/acetate symporter
MPVSLVLMIVVSLATKEPSAEIQAMVDEIRVPSGAAVVDSSH